ncbi:MAG: hypothetical protein ACKPKO_61045, partial [Candidatus Fonsibacter sp.]
TDVCIFMCRNGGQMTLNFGRIIGNIDVDLRELASALNVLLHDQGARGGPRNKLHHVIYMLSSPNHIYRAPYIEAGLCC